MDVRMYAQYPFVCAVGYMHCPLVWVIEYLSVAFQFSISVECGILVKQGVEVNSGICVCSGYQGAGSLDIKVDVTCLYSESEQAGNLAVYIYSCRISFVIGAEYYTLGPVVAETCRNCGVAVSTFDKRILVVIELSNTSRRGPPAALNTLAAW